MTLAEFSEQASRLSRNYGKPFSDERLKVLFETFQRVDAEVFKHAVDEIIAEFLQPPSVSKMREVIRVIYDRRGERPDPLQAERDAIREFTRRSDQCWKCANTGVVSAYRKYRNLEPCMLICTCHIGRLAEKLPEYRGQRKYEPHDPFYLILDTDPHLQAKLDLYRGKYGTTDALMDWLSSTYWNEESKLGPLPWEYPVRLVQ